MHPARSAAPAVISDNFHSIMVYVLGTIVGAYFRMHRSKMAKLKIVMASLISHEINLRRSITAMSTVNPSGGDECQGAVHITTLILAGQKLNRCSMN
jgi:hypothetical protein